MVVLMIVMGYNDICEWVCLVWAIAVWWEHIVDLKTLVLNCTDKYLRRLCEYVETLI